MNHETIFTDVYRRLDELERQKEEFDKEQREIESILNDPHSRLDKARLQRMHRLIIARKERIQRSIIQILVEIDRILEAVNPKKLREEITA